MCRLGAPGQRPIANLVRNAADTSNLFVLFYTTKPGGTGIGLTPCRQIATMAP